MFLVLLRVAGIHAAHAILEPPERRAAPVQDRTKTVIGTADFVVRLAVHDAVKAHGIRQRHPPDLADIFFKTMPGDLQTGIRFQHLLQLRKILNH